MHTDERDDQPSFLFNFGSPCTLKLHDYKVDIQLDPYDVAIFNTATINHSTLEVPGNEGDEERWAFSAWFRLSILKKAPVSQVKQQRVLDMGAGPSTKRVKYTY